MQVEFEYECGMSRHLVAVDVIPSQVTSRFSQS